MTATSIKYREASFMERTGWCSNSKRISLWMITTPSARLRTLRGFLLIAQPPLLGEEGKVSPVALPLKNASGSESLGDFKVVSGSESA